MRISLYLFKTKCSSLRYDFVYQLSQIRKIKGDTVHINSLSTMTIFKTKFNYSIEFKYMFISATNCSFKNICNNVES